MAAWFRWDETRASEQTSSRPQCVTETVEKHQAADERYTGKNYEHHSSNMCGQRKIIPLLLPPPLPKVLEIHSVQEL